MSSIFVVKSEFSRVHAYPTTRNATKTSPKPRPTPQSLWERVPSFVDPPHDANNLSFDGGDGKPEGSDENTDVNACFRDSGAPASQQHFELYASIYEASLKEFQAHAMECLKASTENLLADQEYQIKVGEKLISITTTMSHNTDRVEKALTDAYNQNNNRFHTIESKLESLLQKMDAAWTENAALHEAYHASREETALRKAAIHTLMEKLKDNITMSGPPSPEVVATTSTVMEEMMMQLSIV
jgi:hypothetical protein